MNDNQQSHMIEAEDTIHYEDLHLNNCNIANVLVNDFDSEPAEEAKRVMRYKMDVTDVGPNDGFGDEIFVLALIVVNISSFSHDLTTGRLALKKICKSELQRLRVQIEL